MQPESSMAKGLEVTVLVSVGRHPVTGRARRADQDARGVELAKSLPGAEVGLLYAGQRSDGTEPALRGYLGMGFGELSLLEQPEGTDVVPALAEALDDSSAQLVVAGERAEQGEGSGLLPYLLAERLGWPLVTSLAAVESVTDGQATLLQALPRGQRRRIKVRLPALLTVDGSAPAPRQSAYGPARRGQLDVSAGPVHEDDAWAKWQVQPARKRPKRLKIVKATSARDRFKAAAAKAEGGGGQVLTDATPQEGAEAILKLLREEAVLR